MGDCKIFPNTYAYLKSFLGAVDKQASNASNNMASKDSPSYVKTEVNINIQNGGVSASSPSQVVNENLVNAVRGSNSKCCGLMVRKNYYDRLEQLFGLRGTQSTIAHSGANMLDALRKAEINPDPTNKLQAVDAIDIHLKDLNNLANEVQKIRGEIDQDIASAKDRINSLLTTIADLNLQISMNLDDGVEKFGYINARRQALQELSQFIGIKVTPFDNNQVKVVTEANNTLVQGTVVATLTYDPVNSVSADTTFNPILATGLGGNANLTNALSVNGRTGELPSLLYLRDKLFNGLQQQLDNYAFTLRDSFNEIHNTGTAVYTNNQLESKSALPNGDAIITNESLINGTGTVRIGVYNNTNSKIDGSVTIDLSTIDNIGDLIDAINNANVPNLNASLDGGRVKITTNAPNGVGIGAVGDLDPKLCSGSTYNENNALGFSHFFGFNNLIESQGSLPNTKTVGLANIVSIKKNMLDSSGLALATGRISKDLVLPSSVNPEVSDLGERETFSVIKKLADTYQSVNKSFDQTSTSSVVSSSLQEYITQVVASHLQVVKDNTYLLNTEKALYDALSASAFDISGVNPAETMQQIYDLAISKRMGLNAMGVLNKMNDVSSLLR